MTTNTSRPDSPLVHAKNPYIRDALKPWCGAKQGPATGSDAMVTCDECLHMLSVLKRRVFGIRRQLAREFGERGEME